MNKRVVLAGSGYIGKALERVLRERGYGIRIGNRLTDYKYEIVNCDLVINAAGYAGDINVDDCNTNRGQTMEDNVLFAVKLRDICHSYSKPMIHISSGCVFDGTARDGKPWTEKDQPNFTFRNTLHSFYTGSKYLAEQFMEGHMVWVCRIRMPFGPEAHPRNLITKLAGYPVILAGLNSMSQVDESARAMVSLFEEFTDYGIYHIVNSGRLDTWDAYQMITEKLLVAPKKLEPAKFYKPLMSEPRSTTVLSNQKLLDLGIPMTDVKEAFQKALEEYK